MPGTYYWSALAYDQGRLYLLNFDGRLSTLAPASGATLWSRQLGQYSFSTPPVGYGGFVYLTGAGSGVTAYAVRGSDGIVVARVAPRPYAQRVAPVGGGRRAARGLPASVERPRVGVDCDGHAGDDRRTGERAPERHAAAEPDVLAPAAVRDEALPGRDDEVPGTGRRADEHCRDRLLRPPGRASAAPAGAARRSAST